jgi:SAM-dependent methyltransferase
MANRPAGWEWDQSLYAGAAQYYLAGRMPYPAELGDVLAGALGLDGTGRLLDVGCGPGPLTILLAPFFASAVGIDASTGMIAAARAQAERACSSRTVHARSSTRPPIRVRLVSTRCRSPGRPEPRSTC